MSTASQLLMLTMRHAYPYQEVDDGGPLEPLPPPLVARTLTQNRESKSIAIIMCGDPGHNNIRTATMSITTVSD